VKRSKKIFLGASVVFFILMAIVAIDMASRTTFPWMKSNVEADSTHTSDSLSNPD
jgi:hypothetical protein